MFLLIMPIVLASIVGYFAVSEKIFHKNKYEIDNYLNTLVLTYFIFAIPSIFIGVMLTSLVVGGGLSDGLG
jgi:hypothetical protein